MLIAAARRLRDAVGGYFSSPSLPGLVTLNPLVYAGAAFEEYVAKWGTTERRVLFLGMNPGPWGMAQTGVPFGEVSVVRDWLGITAPIGRPTETHPKYPIDGWGCRRSEVSGRRLWGLFVKRFVTPEAFFAEHFVANYCPLLFVGDGGNVTPDRLPKEVRAPLFEACDEHLRETIAALRPRFVVGVGNFAATRALAAGVAAAVAVVLHPSPASPRSNSDWAGTVSRQLVEQGVWKHHIE